MTADIKTIAADTAEFLKKYPEKWTQGVFARDSNGEECNWRSHDACRCLEGHVMYRASMGVLNVAHQSRLGSEAVSEFRDACHGVGVLAAWNDTPGRTVADVIELCERVAKDAS